MGCAPKDDEGRPKPKPVVESPLLWAAWPNPNVCEGAGLLIPFEYGYASKSFFAAWEMACVAVSRDGLGMSESISDFNEGCVLNMEVISGKRDSRGKVAAQVASR